MDKKNIVKQMLSLQQELNDQTNGIGWENGYTKNDKLINWKRCIYMECAELIDSFAWKHWKDISAPTDWDNVKVEIVDIWHFIMSLMLEYYKNNSLGDIDKLCEDIVEGKNFKFFIQSPSLENEKADFEIVNDVEKLIHITTGFKNEHNELLDTYFELSLKCGVNLDVLYSFYVAKNVLNQFRQDHGYKEGTYKKVWNGKEDNEVMIEVLNSGEKDITKIYQRLEKIYKEVA